ncbi:uncharacterized protein RAG0_10769 [Rhynchosporium agropyri]|uniref:Uncharacterized protein n=1 Tax=Rhynchosporium agropyri TaxID=914238 RepID=A0A1E1L180_9HELO|nr:uncharacterized protein RAG0_10769 [Rhynchosporium agropyri]
MAGIPAGGNGNAVVRRKRGMTYSMGNFCIELNFPYASASAHEYDIWDASQMVDPDPAPQLAIFPLVRPGPKARHLVEEENDSSSSSSSRQEMKGVKSK